MTFVFLFCSAEDFHTGFRHVKAVRKCCSVFNEIPHLSRFLFLSIFRSSFMQPNTIEKIRVYGSNVAEWKAALLDEIDADQLPAHYGGNLKDLDGNPMYLSQVTR